MNGFSVAVYNISITLYFKKTSLLYFICAIEVGVEVLLHTLALY